MENGKYNLAQALSSANKWSRVQLIPPPPQKKKRPKRRKEKVYRSDLSSHYCNSPLSYYAQGGCPNKESNLYI